MINQRLLILNLEVTIWYHVILVHHVILIDSCIDNSVECSYHDDKPMQTTERTKFNIPVIVTSLVAVSVVIFLVFFYILYRHHGRRSPDLVQLNESDDENDHHDNVINDQPTIQPAQEAGSLGDQLQVGLTAPTESSQSECSKSTIEELRHKTFMGQYHAVPSSSLVGLQSYHSNLYTVT